MRSTLWDQVWPLKCFKGKSQTRKLLKVETCGASGLHQLWHQRKMVSVMWLLKGAPAGLSSSSLVWSSGGRRRQVRYLNHHGEYNLNVSAGTENHEDGDNEAKKEEDERGSCDEEEDEEEALKEVKEDRHVKKEAEELEVKIHSFSKSKNHDNGETENMKRARSDLKQNKKIHNKSKKNTLKSSIERWSAATLKIMKAEGAFLGNPILRPALRTKAPIGGIGLLDHLLKHMAGKVAPGGADRFRRRHISDKAMEYWTESADLEIVRKQAGVQDPYWMPLPGWKPGDNPTQDPVSASEIKALKEEMAKIRK